MSISGSTGALQTISLNGITVNELGYIYVYVSYENLSDNHVFFDDLTITHTKGPVVQATSYYPFCLQTDDSWTREDVQGNNFLYNAGSEFNEATGNYETFFRQYDPALGRMTAIDPVAGKYSSWSPYNYAFNDPVAMNDPNGADPYYNQDYILQHEYDVAGPVPGMGNDVYDDYGGSNYSLFGFGSLGRGSHGNNQALYGHIYYGSGNNWADGITLSDWTLTGGSEMFRNGLANGLTEIGGKLYYFGPNGELLLAQNNGQVGYWTDYAYGEYDELLGMWSPGVNSVFTPGTNPYPTWTHNEIIDLAFRDILSGNQRKILQNASKSVDGRENHKPDKSYLHGMVDGTRDQTIEEAKSLAKKFIDDQRGLYLDLSGDDALYELGKAMHTLMDMHSPAHKGWQRWYGLKGAKNLWRATKHFFSELGHDQGKYRAAEAIREFYEESRRLKQGGN